MQICENYSKGSWDTKINGQNCKVFAWMKIEHGLVKLYNKSMKLGVLKE